MGKFQLIHARSVPLPRSNFSTDDGGSSYYDPIEVEFSRRPNTGHTSSVSVVVGSNGTGKSRILGSIADAFIALKRGRARRRRFPLDSLAYSVDGIYQNASQTINPGLPLFGGDQEPLLPERLIAVSMSPFDKFPLSPSVPKTSAEEYDDFYHYVGMRDRMNRASVTALLYRAIENLMLQRRPRHLERVSDIFAFLGYQPILNVVLKIELSPSDRSAILGGAPLTRFSDKRGFASDRLRNRMFHGTLDYHRFRESLAYVDKISNGRYATIPITIDGRFYPEFDAFFSLQELRSLGLVRLEAVHVTRFDGAEIDLKSASSGEISIFTTFLSIASILEEGSLVLIDEPETSLHPHWQAKYLELLIDTFSMYQGCHFVLATHSPQIVADTPVEASVYSLDRNEFFIGADFHGESADYLLATAFDHVAPSNKYLKEEIIHALRLAADGEISTKDFADTVDAIEDMGRNLSENGPIQKVISELVATRNATKND